jgi:hypothetical protein
MRIWVHQLLTVLALFGGFLSGVGLLALAAEFIRLPAMNVSRWIALAPVGVLVVALPIGCTLLSLWLVDRCPARCPRCQGPAFVVCHRPFRYECRGCGHLEGPR